MRIRVTDSSRGDSNQNFIRPVFRNRNVRIFQPFAGLHQSDSFHLWSLSLVTRHLSLLFIFQQLTGLNELYCSHQPTLSLLLTNERVQLFHIEAGLAVMSSSELEQGESVFV